MPQDRVAGLNEGAVDYVTKPFDFEEVKLRVGIHLGLANKVHAPARSSSAARKMKRCLVTLPISTRFCLLRHARSCARVWLLPPI